MSGAGRTEDAVRLLEDGEYEVIVGGRPHRIVQLGVLPWSQLLSWAAYPSLLCLSRVVAAEGPGCNNLSCGPCSGLRCLNGVLHE